jgi:hypothetical protein
MYVDSGFKNPIMAATLVYLAALSLLSSRSSWAPFLAGLLVPIAVFLREPFFLTPVVTLSLAAMVGGRRGLVMHVSALAVAGALLLLWLDIYRGPPAEILRYFRVDIPMLYAEIARKRPLDVERWTSLIRALKASAWLLPPAVLGLGWLFSPGRDQRVAKALAVVLFLPPLYEIFAKICVPYHWAQLLPGVAFLGAMGLQWLYSIDRSSSRWLTIGGFAVVAWLAGELDGRSVYRTYRDGYRLSREFAPVMIWGDWDSPAIGRSRYLELAKYVRDNTAPDDRIIVSAYFEPVFPLSGRLPLSATAQNLWVMSTLQYPVRRPEIVEMVRKRPPRLVVESLSFPVRMEDFWPDFENRYRPTRTFPWDDKKLYAGFQARVWELRD